MISDKSIQTLELDKILEQVARLCAFNAGAELVRELQPTTNLEEARLWQRETAEAVDLLVNKVNVSLAGVRDVRVPAINAARGVLLDTAVLLDIKHTLRRAGILKRTLIRL